MSNFSQVAGHSHCTSAKYQRGLPPQPKPAISAFEKIERLETQIQMSGREWDAPRNKENYRKIRELKQTSEYQEAVEIKAAEAAAKAYDAEFSDGAPVYEEPDHEFQAGINP